MFHILQSNYRKEFKHVRVIGEGKFGAVVFEARDLKDNRNYAVKRIHIRENANSEKQLTVSDSKNCPYFVAHYREWDEYAEFNHQVGFYAGILINFIFMHFYFRRKRILKGKSKD